MEIPLARTQPIEKFFVEYNSAAAEREDDGQPRDDNEVLLMQFAEYTDDDSFFSSSDTVIECDPQRLRSDPLRRRAVVSVHNTLQLRALTNGRVPEDMVWNNVTRTSWLYQIHNRAIALQHSSFFIFPARWTPRVMVYNVMHHWLMEMFIFLMILGYAIFQATWSRYTAPPGGMHKPDHIIWADVFYTCLLGFEIIARLFASGGILHKRAFFRSPWRWLDTAVLVLSIMECTWWQDLWNFTAWRLIRTIKCLTYVPAPVRMKLLAKSLLRSTNRLIYVTIFLTYFIFFFGLLGLQLFVGTLHSRCVNTLTGAVTSQVCRSVATGQYGFYWGHHCGVFYTCQADAFPNPHYDFRSFDDIGHAMLSVFQIMTFQGWSELLQETNDGLAMMAFLYYFFTILVCAWIVPSLYLGVFLEKMDKTSRLFVLKQLDFFDHMLTEQRQRMSSMVRLNDYVERDENGFVSHYPAYTLQQQDDKRLTSDDTTSGSTDDKNMNAHRIKSHHRAIQATKWTDEQRIQLQLALTRQRDVAEEAERKRQLQQAALGDLIVEEGGAGKRQGTGRRGASPAGAASGSATQTETSPQPTKERSEFALGGRVGAVQHHPAAYAIGDSHQSDLPFAVRQEVQAEQLRFLDPYTNGASTAKNDMYNSAAALRTSIDQSRTAVPGGGAESTTVLHSRPVSNARPSTRAPSAPSTSVMVAREAAGVVPHRRSMSVRGGTLSRASSMNGRGSLSRLHASMTQVPQAPTQQEQTAYVINDPEGGDFDYAKTLGQKINIIRNIAHMFTEGYPRIISQYLWEHRMMQHRYGLTPLSYTNKYEEEALRRLRQRRAQERREEREELRRSGMGHLIDDDEDEDDDSLAEKPWMRQEGLVPGSMSPIRMARNIRENAPITVFNYIMYSFIIANAVFNASRFDTMPDYWETGTFIAGVCFSVLFMLELLIRLLALGPGPFFTDIVILIEATFMVTSLFQLGYSRANTTSLFNWVRFLRLFRVIPCRPLRRVSRVLIHGFPDMVYALVFFTLYMFMWLLLGMSFFGSRIGWIDYNTSDYTTRGAFETFSHAAYAVAQAFSVNRDQWLYLSWSGMRVRGGYTVMYFIATVCVAFIFRFFFIAVMTYAWQAQQETEDYYFMSGSSHGRRGRRSRFARLPFFDFSVWRSFKHIHGGFDRRDVAPDEIYFLNEDMARQLRLVEAKDRYYREHYGQEKSEWSDMGEGSQVGGSDMYGPDGALVNGPQYVNIGGRLYRQPSLPATEMGFSVVGTPQQRGQLRFARHHRAVPATTYAAAQLQRPAGAHDALPDEVVGSRSLSRHSRRSMANPLLADRHSLSPAHQGTSVGGPSVARVSDSLAEERAKNTNISLVPRLTKLGNARALVVAGDDEATADYSTPEGGVSDEDFEHLLLPGPRLRYKSTMDEGRRVFETCLDCNTHMQMPLRAPPGVAQRTAEELHAEHCHMAAVRSSQQLVLNALIGYTRMQADHEVTPTKRMVEIVLGQAWSCGMLLFDTIENLSCMDLPEQERTWDRMLEALEMQQWLLGLHVGEEQVGRATLAYILANQQRQEAQVREKSYKNTWEDRVFFVLSPSNPVRRAVSAVVGSMWFEIAVLCVVYAASICLAVYAPDEGNRDFGGSYNSAKYKVLHILDDIFSIIFAVEMVLKWISMGVVLPVGRAYFWHRWNIFDFFIVIISLVSWGRPDIFLRYLKVMRCFRILGPLRYWKWGSSSMSHVARAIWDSIPTLANVCLLMLMNYIVWAIIFVSLFMDKFNYCSNASIVNGTQCVEEGYTWAPTQRNFRNFYESLLTTFEISTGAEWIDVIYSAVDSRSALLSPLRNQRPYLGLVFIAYYYVSHFIFFTLFISAVIYCYMLAKSATEDATGTTIEHQVWLRMQGMIFRLKPKVQLLPLDTRVSRLVHFLISNRWFEAFMGLILVFNMLTMSLEWYQMSSTQKTTLDAFQYIWVVIFTLEVVLRFVAHGLRFFTRRAYCWDLLIVVLSYIQIGLSTTATNRVPFNVNVLRMLRVGRVLHLVHLVLPFSTHLTLFHEVLKASVPGLISVTFVYMIAVYVFAILGLHFLGYIVPFGGYIDDKYNNFGTFVNALIMVFRLSTLQNWATMLRGSLDRGYYCARASKRCGPTDWAPVYYIPIVICFFLLLSTLYMAVVLDKYVAAVRIYSAVTRLDELRRFCRLWSKRDPNGTMWLPSAVLPELLEELRLPLGVSDRRNRVEVMQLLREYNIPDHNGRVYYYEVLLPLARRVMAIAFLEAADAHTAGSQAPRDIAWHLSERSLGALPASYGTVRPSSVTVAEHYAAALLQAAFRRDRAMRDYYIAKSELWRRGRAVCVERGLPYDNFGFGKTPLAGPDPREEGMRRGFNIPKDATLANSAGGRVYADPVAARIAAMREAMGSHKRATDQEPPTLLPAVYRSAIYPEEKRFGPNAPGAIRRHERRDEKLERKRAQEEYERQMYERSTRGCPARTAGEQKDNETVTAEGAGDVDVGLAYSKGTMEPHPAARGNQYNLDPMDVNYQPPLGTSPEELRQEKVDRRLNAAAAAATASATLGGISPSTTPEQY
ncbi:putative calcium channel protein [Leishmania infantum JPCM5]|uniref:Calcium_channel_protein_-_putative n=2 Tax=Leishmania infantum TaxID=5671 RepID=A0A6L0XQT4_LEIIN|nr:putative calcium channel protein [Leishmania infantum JPCM5]CAC9536293.1 calcium_channel_protein_-_putative [Leishmania infantum]CAM71521.1 putative calcium channel protein [Leishmania infantum JPCM5]SUZ45410.1 calcium_channel_protein_-_putative [Leishmania infantum]|eukprot:XP_001468437.1 putative calcium channel protein [Leishmania infantum JPCM5]